MRGKLNILNSVLIEFKNRDIDLFMREKMHGIAILWLDLHLFESIE